MRRIYKIFLILFISFTVIQIYGQEIGKVRIGRTYDETNNKLLDESILQLSNKVTYLFETYYGTFNKFQIIIRIIKTNLDNFNEQIYFTETVDIDPEWDVTWGDYTLKEGWYYIKIYSTDGNLLGKSELFGVTPL